MVKQGSHICPRCNQVYVTAFGNTDYVHQCNSRNPTLDNEDVPVVSTTVEEFGREVSTGRKQGCILLQGIQNQLQGTKAGIEGEDVEALTTRGARKSTHRSRQRYTYIGD